MTGRRYILMILLVIFTMTGCGLSDWSYELIGGYEIVHCNSVEIILTNREHGEDGGSIVLPNYRVTDFCMNERFIGIQAIRHKGLEEHDQGIAIGGSAIYLVDAVNHEVYGPFPSQAKYDAKCLELSVGDLGAWRSTNEDPN